MKTALRNKKGQFVGNKIYKQYYCKICKKIIHFGTVLYGSGLCRSCATKKQLKNPKNSGRYTDGFYTKKRYCIDCKKELRSHNRAKYCKKCVEKYKIYPDRHGKNGSTWKGGLPKCSNCGKELTSYINKRCQSCYLKTIKGKNHPNYIKNLDRVYPIEFKSLRIKIRKRDDYTCQKCGMTEEEHLIVHGQVLHVHHIDYNKKNCDKNNLITLCLSCNMRVNFNRNYWEKNLCKK